MNFFDAMQKLAQFEQLFSTLMQAIGTLTSQVNELRADNEQFKADNVKLLAAVEKPNTDA